MDTALKHLLDGKARGSHDCFALSAGCKRAQGCVRSSHFGACSSSKLKH